MRRVLEGWGTISRRNSRWRLRVGAATGGGLAAGRGRGLPACCLQGTDLASVQSTRHVRVLEAAGRPGGGGRGRESPRCGPQGFSRTGPGLARSTPEQDGRPRPPRPSSQEPIFLPPNFKVHFCWILIDLFPTHTRSKRKSKWLSLARQCEYDSLRKWWENIGQGWTIAAAHRIGLLWVIGKSQKRAVSNGSTAMPLVRAPDADTDISMPFPASAVTL